VRKPTALRSMYKQLYSSYAAAGKPAAENAAALIARASGTGFIKIEKIPMIIWKLAHTSRQVNVFVGLFSRQCISGNGRPRPAMEASHFVRNLQRP